MDILKSRPCPDCDNGVAPKGGTTRYDCPTCRPANTSLAGFPVPTEALREQWIREFVDVHGMNVLEATDAVDTLMRIGGAAIERRARQEGYQEGYDKGYADRYIEAKGLESEREAAFPATMILTLTKPRSLAPEGEETE